MKDDKRIGFADYRRLSELVCWVDGCDQHVKFGYMACRKHVRERRRLLCRHGWAAVAAMEVSVGTRTMPW